MLFRTLNRPNGFDITKISPSDIDIRDIAISASNSCRYNGHVRRFYSVAEHCLRVADMVSDEYKYEALMHDASEAYLSDVVQPLRDHMPHYQKIEKKVQLLISKIFSLPDTMSPSVHRADIYIREFEMYELMNAPKPIDYDNMHFTNFGNDNIKIGNVFLNIFNHYRRQYAKR